MSFVNDMMGDLKQLNLLGSIAENEEGAAEFTGCIDTGCYALNALLSGSIYGGVPNNKILAFAGEPATGKHRLRRYHERHAPGYVSKLHTHRGWPLGRGLASLL